MLRFAILFCCVATLLVSGCATMGKSHSGLQGEKLSLEQWVDSEAVPYLIRELGDNPRFKGQPFLLVSMKRDNVEAQIDGLTMQIRDTITDGLLAKPGIGLIWRPSAEPWEHHTQVKPVHCTRVEKETIYVGIDAFFSKLDGDLHVKIRALDIAEKRWITGFGISWQGRASSLQEKALSKKKPDDYLLGLRPLPFNENQADLMAAYVSRNLSCLFTNMDLDEAVIHVERQNPERIRYFDNAFGLIDNYIASYRKVTVTDDPYIANIRVLASVHEIHKGLYQVWITPRYKVDKRYLPGKETQAYVFFDNAVIKASVPLEKTSKDGIRLETHSVSDKTIDLCFMDFKKSIEKKFYPILTQYPGAVAVNRNVNNCDTYGTCICYEITVKNKRFQKMEEMTLWMEKSLMEEGITRFEIIPKSLEHLTVKFFAGFD
ncbi:MAG: hypothetical protein MI892_08225 [Desulfobacterales bacterium]|nr:hypothetical protein [Desulfobacterales bacterium]